MIFCSTFFKSKSNITTKTNNRFFNIIRRHQLHITFRAIARGIIGFIPFAFHRAKILGLRFASFPYRRRTITGSLPSKKIYQTFHVVKFYDLTQIIFVKATFMSSFYQLIKNISPIHRNHLHFRIRAKSGFIVNLFSVAFHRALVFYI